MPQKTCSLRRFLVEAGVFFVIAFSTLTFTVGARACGEGFDVIEGLRSFIYISMTSFVFTAALAIAGGVVFYSLASVETVRRVHSFRRVYAVTGLVAVLVILIVVIPSHQNCIWL